MSWRKAERPCEGGQARQKNRVEGGRRFWKLLLVPFPGKLTPWFLMLSQDLALSPPQTSTQCSWACSLSLPPHGGGEPKALCSRERGAGVSQRLREIWVITLEKGGQTCTQVWMVRATSSHSGGLQVGLSEWVGDPLWGRLPSVLWDDGRAMVKGACC